MAFCAVCNDERPEQFAMRPDMRMARTCDRGHALPEEAVAIVQAAPTDRQPARAASKPSAISLGELPRMVRARKKELRALIKQAERELAALERLTKPARKSATVTPIKRAVS